MSDGITDDAGIRLSKSASLIAMGLVVLLTAPSLISFGMPAFATLPILSLVPLVTGAFVFTNALRGAPVGFVVSIRLLIIFTLNIAVFIAAIFYSLLYGADEAQDQMVNTAAYVFIATFSSLLFCTLVANDRYAIVTLMSALFLAVLLVCLLNVFLIFTGFQNPAGDTQPQTQSPGMFTSMLGLNINRIMMPLSTGFQNGAVAPVTLCVLAAGFSGRHKVLRYFGFGLGALLLMLLDTRMFIFAIAMAFGARMLRSPAAVAMMGLVYPWLEVTLVNFSQQFPFLASLATGRAGKYGLFSGREFIWNTFWGYFEEARPWQLIFGNGLFGHSNTGLSREYREVFYSWPAEARATISLHNTFLQMIMDTGLFGLGIFCALLFTAIRRAEILARTGSLESSAWKAVSALLLTFASIAGTEMVIGWYMKESVSITAYLFLALGLFGGGWTMTTRRDNTEAR